MTASGVIVPGVELVIAGSTSGSADVSPVDSGTRHSTQGWNESKPRARECQTRSTALT